jgi:hydrogenase expression/formation protein HypC
MCLAIPAQVVELRDDGRAVVEVGGVRKDISVDLLETVALGDYVIIHVGFALTRLDPEEARKTLALLGEAAAAFDAAEAAADAAAAERDVATR